MKRLLGILLLALPLFAGSCSAEIIMDSKDYVTDWAPVTLCMLVCDEDGNGLVTPELEGVSISFNGKIYNVRTKADLEGERVPMFMAPQFYGLYIAEYQALDRFGNLHRHALMFGEIDGAADMDEDLVLTWSDGSTNTIHYHCSEHTGGLYPNCTRYWLLNGVKVDNPVTIVKHTASQGGECQVSETM